MPAIPLGRSVMLPWRIIVQNRMRMGLDPFTRGGIKMLVWLLFGCGANGELTSFPASIDWGEINFREEQDQDKGYDSRSIALTNTGETPLKVSITGVDLDLLRLEGFTDTSLQLPIDLGNLNPGNSFTIFLGVWDYIHENGTGSVTSGSISVTHSGEESPLQVPWTFIPVNEFTDTGTP